ncbi:MAG: gamma-mobile-trio integrase GmtZ, partial [Pseudobdellovibrionaceae bacterium]
GIKTVKEYKTCYKQDPQLLREPNTVYNEWTSWGGFLRGEPKRSHYKTLAEAQIAAQRLGIKTVKEYQARYKQDPQLPSNPHVFYSEWTSWDYFLIPTHADCLIKAKTLAQMAGIQSAREYAMRYEKLNVSLPRHPDRVFRKEWVDWFDFLGISRKLFYSYNEASRLVRDEGITTKAQYDKYRVNSGDSRLYRNPHDHYDEWVNWYVFFDTQEPFQPQYIRGKYKPWKTAINKFMKKARGGSSKKTSLCKFQRLYIEKYGLGYSPVEFLTSGTADKKLYSEFLDEAFPSSQKNKAANHINEFIDYILRTDLTLEDKETGELIRIDDAENPFQNIYVDEIREVGKSETIKPRLQFQFVKNAREWIIPNDAKTFIDLDHLYEGFDSDWHEIHPSLIDKSDPNYVGKELEVGNKTKHYIWSPINWIHTYVLMELTLRGVQIAYNDSGEGDVEIPVLDENGKIFWRKNNGPLVGQTKNQSMVKKYPNGALGYYSTTNKTSNVGNGLSVPWIPEKVAYWLIRLREWQSKYNPIQEATPWTECKRTNLNELQLRAKGCNCFLFRGYGQVEAISFQASLANRIAASLYHTQPEGITLATCKSDKLNSVSHYESPYSPHAMRVGLISALVFEYGLPIEIVMKIVGHSSIVMTLYYCKTSSADLIKRMEEGEKKALQRETYAVQRHIEQQQIEAVKNQLASNSEEILSLLNNNVPGANFTFSDIGICPFANSRCHEGGEEINNSRLYAPVPEGYLGKQNCVRCRFFVTGPAYIGGLLSIGNEISLQANLQSQQYSKIEKKISGNESQLNELDIQEYERLRQGIELSSKAKRFEIERELRKLRTELEKSAAKMDVFLCDLQCIYRLLKQCQDLLNKQSSTGNSNELMLLKHSNVELALELEETSTFHQLSEVCENAQIYDSANADIAITPRSQMLDRMADCNGMKPFLYKLTGQQQLEVGNQMTKLLLLRLKSWEKVSEIVEGTLHFADLTESERLIERDIALLSNDVAELPIEKELQFVAV